MANTVKFWAKHVTSFLIANTVKFLAKNEGYTTLRRTTLRLLNHFVEKAFCRIVILSNFHFVETVFRRILSTNYSMLTHPFIVSGDHLDCEATDTGEGYQSEADCCFYEGARGGVKQ